MSSEVATQQVSMHVRILFLIKIHLKQENTVSCPRFWLKIVLTMRSTSYEAHLKREHFLKQSYDAEKTAIIPFIHQSRPWLHTRFFSPIGAVWNQPHRPFEKLFKKL